MRFVIEGPPRTKKTHQRIARRKDGSPFILSAKSSVNWERKAIEQLLSQAQPCITGTVNCRALIYRERLVGDAVNYYQAIADALQGAGVVQNDRLIVSWDGSRLLKDAHRPRVEIELMATS